MRAATGGREGFDPGTPAAVVRRKADEAAWLESLVTLEGSVLIGMARNYLGPVKTPYDKRSIATKLAAFVRKPETRASMISLLDIVDARLLGTLLLTGPLGETGIRDLFAEEFRAFDLGLKLSNLQDRLLLFRLETARETLLAVNPILAGDLEPLVLDSRVILGLEDEGTAPEGAFGAEALVALFGFLHNQPGGLRKNGSLGKKAAARLAALLPAYVAQPAVLAATLQAFERSGVLEKGEEGEVGSEVEPVAFAFLVDRWGFSLPLRLAASLVEGPGEGLEAPRARRADRLADFLADALSAMPTGSSLSPGGLRLWLGIIAYRSGLGPESGAAALVGALASLGLLDPAAGGRIRLSSVVPRREATESGGTAPAASPPPSLVADGAHLLRVLPEADLAARCFALRIAEPRSYGKVWELELERATIRRALATGLTATSLLERLEALSVRALPQSLAFSIRSWEEEYRSLRLYHGFVLACDERRRLLVEGNPALRDLVMEKLGDGVYMLAARSLEEVRSRLEEAGIEAPPSVHPHPGDRASGTAAAEGALPSPAAEGEANPERSGEEDEKRGPASREVGRLLGVLVRSGARPSFDPLPRLEALRAELAGERASSGAGSESGRPRDLEKEMADRIEARLVLDEDQLRRADPALEKVEAGGLDYAGKVRLVERALKRPGDRLEIQYQLPGAGPARALVRPVRLEKGEKGLVLEGEDLGTGGPIRLPLGAASLLRRLRASPFGEER